jgi:hypothetical protein
LFQFTDALPAACPLQVADVCVEALVCPAAADKVVEVVAEKSAPERSLQALFAGVV